MNPATAAGLASFGIALMTYLIARMAAKRYARDVIALREADAEKEEFLSAVAHDLRTPLTTIKGLTQVSLQRSESGKEPLPESAVAALRRIDANSTRVARLIDEMLDVARTGAQRPIELDLEDADLVEIVDACVAEQQATSRRHQIELRSSIDHFAGQWDVRRVSRAVSNVLSNAIRYSPSGGSISVTIRELANGRPEAFVQVRDHGIGIPEDDLPHIFERFHRGANAAGRIPGSGIGLSGARQIIELHGGHIDVESIENQGTTISIHLPQRSPVEPS